jgi:hypothetical protein
MTDCCSTHQDAKHYPGKYRCPANGREYGRVDKRTLLHHIARPWDVSLAEQGYYFCSDPECQVVYFGQDNSVISRSELRTRVFEKETDPERLVCYCFCVMHKQASTDKNIRKFILEKTSQSMCSCATSNPSGRCCLKNLPGQAK